MWYKTTVISLVSGVAVASVGSGFTTGDRYVECWENYESEKNTCTNTFNGSGQTYQDPEVYTICLTGAEENMSVCMNSDLDQSDYLEAWTRYLDRLKDCITDNQNDPIGKESCISMAFLLYQAEINDLLFPDPQNAGCQTSSGAFALASPMYALESAAQQLGNANGKFPVKVNTSLSFTAGVNADPGSSYNAQQIPCVKSAIAIAVYDTKAGTKVLVFDADLNTADGTSFVMHLIGSELMDATEVHLFSVFYDENAAPLFSEFGTLELQDSPVTGDWNRDEVLNTQDVIDFLTSYNAQTKRADINGDTQITPTDAVDFINTP